MSDQDILHNLLHKIATEQGFQNYKLKVNPISTGGANFSSLLYTATITSGARELSLFIKVAAMKEKIRKQMLLKTYETEIYVYSDLKTAYKVLEEQHQVPEHQLLYLPKYYGANTTYLNEILVLENLESRGFVTHDRRYSIDWEYATTAVLELVKLHALSIAFQRENPEQFRTFNEEILADWLNEESMNAFCKTGFATTLTVVREENKGKMKRFLDAVDLAAFKKLLEPSRCKVLTHRDFRPSNLMHRRKNDGSLEIVVVDHQTIQIGCPVIDLLYLIFTGTDKEFRDQYFDQLIQYYYTQLSEAMERLGIDPETTYSKEDFDFEMKEKLPFGLAVAAFTLPIITVESEHAPELNSDMDLSSFSIQTTGALFPARINGVIDDYVKWGILKD